MLFLNPLLKLYLHNKSPNNLHLNNSRLSLNSKGLLNNNKYRHNSSKGRGRQVLNSQCNNHHHNNSQDHQVLSNQDNLLDHKDREVLHRVLARVDQDRVVLRE